MALLPVDELSVFHGELLMGTLFDTTPLSFAYAPQWLEHDSAFALPNIGLQAECLATPAVEAVFENLLPEGIIRGVLRRQTHASSTFGLLRAVAGDTAGGLTILPAGQMPEAPSYQAVEWSEIARHFAGQLSVRGAVAPLGSRISLSGAQAKMLIALSDGGKPLLPKGSSPSTWIVKPDISGFEKVWSSAANEAIVMRTAAYCGLGVAQVFFEPTTRSCVVQRFDRGPDPSGRLVRLKQYDFCQLSGLPSGKKYEVEGGPGIAQCAALIKAHSAQPAVDLKRFCDWLFFNIYTGNNDSHAKNLALYEHPGKGLRLAPFYDLMDTRLYPGLSRHFALRIGGEDQPGKMTSKHLDEMADELSLKPFFVKDRAKSVHTKLGPALARAIADTAPFLDSSGKTLSSRLQQHVTSIANKSAARFVGLRPASPTPAPMAPDTHASHPAKV